MKKLLLVVFLLILLAGGYALLSKKPEVSPLVSSRTNEALKPTAAVISGESKSSVFVPYWSLSSDFETGENQTLIYFGITPGSSGVNKEEVGYTSLSRFEEKAGSKKTYLTLRMLDSKQNFAILENQKRQDVLIRDVLATAKAYGFDGVILDLEVSALPFDSLIKQISDFNKRFYQAVKKENLHYGIALYGDTFYRIRPFDVEVIARYTDEVMIMAYDLHKSRGNPGPNFPLQGKEKYGYDYPTLINQFSDAVPKEKLTVIFGLFGYDWEVNNEKNMVSYGEPLSFLQIQNRFITNCPNTTCTKNRDAVSAESFISYTDDEGQKHLVWFEDIDSVKQKQEYLATLGITSFSYWAHSYY